MALERPVETPALPLECGGLTAKDYSLPPFQLRPGEAVCLHVPLPSPRWQNELLPILSGRIAHPALRFHGVVSYLERPNPRRRWWGGWHSPPILDWLTAAKGLTSEEAQAVLNRVGEPPDMSVGRLGWNERTMLAVEVCLLRPPDLLAFDTCGNDPAGTRRAFERLACRSPDFALLYLKTRLEKEDPCLPGAGCLSLTYHPSRMRAVE